MFTFLSLFIYDSDNTFVDSPLPPPGWVGGWWSKLESMLPPYMPEHPDASWFNAEVVASAKAAVENPDVYAVLMTGRMPKFTDRVTFLCESQGVFFQELLFNKGGPTEQFKMREMRRLIDRTGARHLELWEDRHFEVYRPFLERLVETGVLDSFVLHEVTMR